MPKKQLEWKREGACMVVTSHKPNQDGYIRMFRGGRLFYLHREVCERKHGKLPKGIETLHSCDNKRCINPSHLVPGAHQQNISDAVQRLGMNQGENHGSSKLTAEQVLAIRASADGCRKLARAYGVSREAILHIRSRKTWRHL